MSTRDPALRRVALPWGRMAVTVRGDGPPLLALHGLGGSRRYWDTAAPLLAARHTLVTPDLAGFGRSDAPDAAYDADFHVAAVDGLLDALDLRGRIAVAGHSMGGVIAALWAARHPERVASLAVVAAPFPHPRRTPPPAPPGRTHRAGHVLIRTAWPVLSWAVRRRPFPHAVVADRFRCTPQSYGRSLERVVFAADIATELPSLRRLGAPALLLFSEDDRTIARESLTRWQAVLPQATTRLTTGGHHILLTPSGAELAAWLDAQQRRAA